MHNILKGYTTTTVNSVSIGTTAVPSGGPIAWGSSGGDYYSEGRTTVPMNTLTGPYYSRTITDPAGLHDILYQEPDLFVPQYAPRRVQLPALRREREVHQPDHQHDHLHGAREPQRRRGDR